VQLRWVLVEVLGEGTPKEDPTMRTQLLIAGLSTITFCSVASAGKLQLPRGAKAGYKKVSTTIFAPHQYARPAYTYYAGGGAPGIQVWTDGTARSFGGARWAQAEVPARRNAQLAVPAGAKLGYKRISMGSGMSGMIGPAYFTNGNGYRVDIGTYRAFEAVGQGERMGLYGPHGQYPNGHRGAATPAPAAPATSPAPTTPAAPQ
jgi:hypothetical protein